MFVYSTALALITQLVFGLHVSDASPGVVLAQTETSDLGRTLQSDNSSRCSAFPVCRGLNLTGDCCPTINGTLLNCCNATSSGNMKSPTDEPTSSGNVTSPTDEPTRRPRRPPSEQPSEEPSSAPAANSTTPTRRPRNSPIPTPKQPSPSASPPTNNTSQQCSAFPVCQADGLSGNCCPTNTGVELYCCNEVEANCQDNAACVLANLTGACCPTATGEFLACCNRKPNNCAAHSGCAHLVGNCCPTEAGTYLDCCSNNSTKPDTNGTVPDSNGTVPGTNGTNNEIQALCSSHPKCAGLEGECCPTKSNVFLYCCDKYRDTCATHSKCANLGLVGQCCPAENGTFLGCCERDFAACSANPACEAEGKSGNCCPRNNGKFEDCCLNDTSVRSLEFESVVSEPTSAAAGERNAVVALVVAALVALL